MRHLMLLATGVFLIAASGQTVAGPFSPAGLSRVDGLSLIEFVRDKPKSETLSQKVKRVWRDLTGYKFEVSCPAFLSVNHSTCTETGKSREDARARCQSRNAFCWVADAS
jgi:hypothetical protein